MDQTPQAAPEANPVEPPVQSGLLLDAAEAAQDPEAATAPPANTAPIQIAEPEAPMFKMDVAVSAQAPEGWVEPQKAPEPVETARQRKEREWHEEQEAKRRAFIQARMKAQEPSFEQKPAPFVSPHVAAQTQAEMAAGRAMNEHHAGVQAIQPRRVDPRENGGAKMVPVFRPSDYTQPPLKTLASAHVPTRTAQVL